ncbi:MAG: porin [Opitutus sp.]|nr:porin [Opitutus sp.]MCS6247992.1 porin [Opitutus sp.]MCS6274548.1 porin [Opitutus sp.]MCS6299849.1 porin [Opitutus sp.]
MKWGVAAGVSALLSGAAMADTLPSAEEMWALIQKQQKQIDELSRSLATATERTAQVDARTKSVEQKVEATSAHVESLATETAGKGGGLIEGTTIGGYGELHYNSGPTDMIDFHRFVLFVNHDFNEKMRLVSELEVEHALVKNASTGQPGSTGELELEQAYVEFDLTAQSQAKAGLFLLPIGILNETHEPATFYGVERNKVESDIIPTTWWEGGVAYSRQFESGLSYDVAVHSGLTKTAGADLGDIRKSRQKVASADAQDGAVTSRVKYTGIKGLTLATSVQYQQDIAQSTLARENADALLTSVHADWRKGGFGLRALYARWDINGPTAQSTGRDVQYGYYIEPSYRFPISVGELGFFARYSVVDNQAGNSAASEKRYTDLGVNYWPHAQIVLKADVQFVDNPTAIDEEIFSLGLGFQF